MIIPQNPTALPLYQRAKLISIYSHNFFLFGLQNWQIGSVLLQILNSRNARLHEILSTRTAADRYTC